MATKEKTKADQIFEAAQSAYDSCKALRNTVEAMMRSQGVNPQELKKKTAGVYLDPKKLSDKDAFIGALVLKKYEREAKSSTKSNTKANQALMSRPRVKI